MAASLRNRRTARRAAPRLLTVRERVEIGDHVWDRMPRQIVAVDATVALAHHRDPLLGDLYTLRDPDDGQVRGHVRRRRSCRWGDPGGWIPLDPNYGALHNQAVASLGQAAALVVAYWPHWQAGMVT